MSKRVKKWKKSIRRHNKQRARLRPMVRRVLPKKTLALPEDFRLIPDLLAGVAPPVVQCLSELRGHVENVGEFGLSVNFDAVRRIDAAAALMLTAEIHLWDLSKPGVGLRSHDHSWNPEIRQLLADMGLFQFLGVKVRGALAPENAGAETFVRFVSNDRVDMSNFVKFREDIEKRIGENLGEFVMNLLYSGLQEAVTNVRQHAYADGEKHPRWWVSASFNSDTRNLKVLCYDRGRTIPGTLRSRGEAFMNLMGASSDDSGLIEKALHSRTSTKEIFRGAGAPRNGRHHQPFRIRGGIERLQRQGIGPLQKGGKHPGQKRRILAHSAGSANSGYLDRVAHPHSAERRRLNFRGGG